MTYENAQQYLLDIPRFTKKNPLENTEKFMEYLGEMWNEKSPEVATSMCQWDNVIHVAGTNGKGSTCAFISNVLAEAGCKVGMFTSPHLVSMTERFRVNGQPISRESFAGAFDFVKNCVDDGVEKGLFDHPTFFEFLVGMAYVIFTEEHVDCCVLETGLGGKLDATNIVRKPLACVITSVGLDHTEFLGDTLTSIAGEKAGIIKEGVPVVFDGNKDEVAKVIRDRADALNAPICEVSMKNCEIKKLRKKTIDFLFHSEYYNNVLISLETSAQYQIMNAALAAVTIKIIDKNNRIGTDKVLQGLRNTTWPGRMEWLEPHFLIDGAHNEDGIQQAVKSVAGQFDRMILLYSAVRDKDYHKIIHFLCKSLDFAGVVVTELDTPRAVKAEELYGIFKECYEGPLYMEKGIADAVRQAEAIREEGMIFGTGSLYLVGELQRLKR